MLPALLASFILLIVPSPSLADDTETTTVVPNHTSLPCEVRPVIGGIECIKPDGDIQWNLHHPSLWPDDEAYLEQRDGEKPIAPVVIDDTAIYAVERDLIEVDIHRGNIENRLRFPAPISALATSDQLLEVLLDIDTVMLEEVPQQRQRPDQPLLHRPGSSIPATAAITLDDIFGPATTAIDAERLLTSAHSEQQAIHLLRQAQSADPTNPFYSQLLGTVLHESGDPAAASRAFSNAADSPEALWQDLMRVAVLLEDSPAGDEASYAQQLGLTRLEALDLDMANLATLLPLATSLLADSDDVAAIIAAVEAGDFETALRLGIEIAQDLPDLDELTRHWDQIATENRTAAYEIVAQTLAQLDRAILAMLSLLISLLLLSLFIGLRFGVRRRLHPLELLAPPVLLAAVVALLYVFNMHLMVAQDISNIPVADFQHAQESPETQRWLMEMASDPHVQSLLADVFSRKRHVDDGTEGRTPLVRILVDTAYADAERTQWELARSGRMPNVAETLQYQDGSPSEFRAPGTISLFYVLIPLIALILIGGLGFAFGRYLPSVARPLVFAFPARPSIMAPLGAFSFVLFVSAAAAIAGLDTTAQRFAIPALEHALDLNDVDQLTTEHSRSWAWFCLIFVPLMHAVVVGTYYRLQRTDQPVDQGS